MGSTEVTPSSHYRRVTPLAQRKKLRRSTALLRVAQWGSPEEVDVDRCSIASVALARIRAHHRPPFSVSASITYLPSQFPAIEQQRWQRGRLRESYRVTPLFKYDINSAVIVMVSRQASWLQGDNRASCADWRSKRIPPCGSIEARAAGPPDQMGCDAADELMKFRLGDGRCR
jgi:hypothetical protein